METDKKDRNIEWLVDHQAPPQHWTAHDQAAARPGDRLVAIGRQRGVLEALCVANLEVTETWRSELSPIALAQTVEPQMAKIAQRLFAQALMEEQ